MKNLGGRPKELNNALIDKADEYLNGGYMAAEEVPTIAGLALYIDKRRSTVYEWVKENERFSDIVSKIMAKQERELLNGSLKGDYNSTISKLMLTKHGYSDKVESEISGPNGSPIQVQEVKLTIVDPQH
jgi:hypothetical protein